MLLLYQLHIWFWFQIRGASSLKSGLCCCYIDGIVWCCIISLEYPKPQIVFLYFVVIIVLIRLLILVPNERCLQSQIQKFCYFCCNIDDIFCCIFISWKCLKPQIMLLYFVVFIVLIPLLISISYLRYLNSQVRFLLLLLLL